MSVCAATKGTVVATPVSADVRGSLERIGHALEISIVFSSDDGALYCEQIRV
jgi:hypothetical protein